MSSFLPPVVRRAAFGALGALAVSSLIAACGRGDDRPQRAPRRTVRSFEAPGEVTKSWNPKAVAAVGAAQGPAVRAAIQGRLGAARPAGVPEDHWEHVRSLYKYYDASPLWIDAQGLMATRVQALTRAMLVADSSDALDLSEYPMGELANALQALKQAGGNATAQQIAEADVLLSASYASLGEDLLSGQVNPKSMEQDWHIDTRDRTLDSLLAGGLVTDALDSSLAVMRPQEEGYVALGGELARYRAIVARGGWGQVSSGKALAPGGRDAPTRLAALRARLQAEGYDVGGAAPTVGGGDSAAAQPAAAPTPAPAPNAGVYDRALAGAVAQFQRRHAIDVDSVLGAGTVEAMNLAADYRLAQIAANMERYRWMPRDFGDRYIYVNVPAFKLEAYDSGQKVMDMKVVVGQEYEGRKTPVFADSMEMVVFRPFWNVTDDIASKEIWPKVNADPGYLDANNMETFKDGGVTRIRQRPGEKNSLGFVKFLFPNTYNIYLHDTPAKTLFEKDIRAFSHGCIRLEKPAALAEWVLGWPADKVEAAMQSGGDNRTVRLPKKLPVYITYFTAYVDDGTLHFGNDLYDRDDALVQAAGAAAKPNPAVQQAVAALRQLAS